MNRDFLLKQKQGTRKKILKEANKLFLKNGIEVTTIAAIAKSSDVTRATVYAHFAHKRDLVIETLYVNLDQLYQFEFHEDESSSIRDNLIRLLTLTLDSFIDNPKIMRFLVEYYKTYSEYADDELIDTSEFLNVFKIVDEVKLLLLKMDDSRTFDARMRGFYTVFNLVIGVGMRYSLRKNHFIGVVERSSKEELYEAVDKLVDLI